MKKIRAIYVDGIKGTGKSSILKELKKHFRTNTEKDVYEVQGNTLEDSKKTEIILEDNSSGLVLKKGSILTDIFDDMMSSQPFHIVEDKYLPIISEEGRVNHIYGVLHILLVPTQPIEFIERSKELLSEDYKQNIDMVCSYMGDGLSTLKFLYPLTIEKVEFNMNDRIIDVTNKVMKVLDKYKI